MTGYDLHGHFSEVIKKRKFVKVSVGLLLEETDVGCEGLLP